MYMMTLDTTTHEMRQQAYTPEHASIFLGKAKVGETLYADIPVRIPLATLNRHGLIA